MNASISVMERGEGGMIELDTSDIEKLRRLSGTQKTRVAIAEKVGYPDAEMLSVYKLCFLEMIQLIDEIESRGRVMPLSLMDEIIRIAVIHEQRGHSEGCDVLAELLNELVDYNKIPATREERKALYKLWQSENMA